MSTDTTVSNLIINKLTKAQYDAATKNPTELYYVTDDDAYQEKLTAGTGVDITNNIIKSVGVENVNGGTIIKTWTGTKAQYDAITTKDTNTTYITTDEPGDSTEFADIDLSNISNAGKIISSELSMPAYTIFDTLTIGATSTVYTAPQNGWYYALIQLSPNGWFQMMNAGVGQRAQNSGTNTGYYTIFVPTKKNDNFALQYDGFVSGATYNTFKFIYAEGSKSEAN